MSVFKYKNYILLYNLLSSLLATETAQQLKKTAGVPFHAKGRGLVKKIDTTSEFLDWALQTVIILMIGLIYFLKKYNKQ